MRRVAVSLLCVALALAPAACGASSTLDTPGVASVSCDVPFAAFGLRHVCEEYAPLPPDKTALVAAGCTQLEMGTVVAACPTQGLLGSCALGPENALNPRPTTELLYSDGGLTAGGAQFYCKVSRGGTWTGQ